MYKQILAYFLTIYFLCAKEHLAEDSKSFSRRLTQISGQPWNRTWILNWSSIKTAQTAVIFKILIL